MVEQIYKVFFLIFGIYFLVLGLLGIKRKKFDLAYVIPNALWASKSIRIIKGKDAVKYSVISLVMGIAFLIVALVLFFVY